MQLPKSSRILAFILGVGIMTVGFASHAQAQTAASTTPTDNAPAITIGYVNWTEAIAVTHLMQALLQNKFNYRVELKLVSVEQAFRGVATGKLDAFLDVWLPETHANYWAEYGDQVNDLGPWYRGIATLGLAVPNYVKAQSISDLKGEAQIFNSRVIGIQPGAGVMRITGAQALPEYGLNDYMLQSGSTKDLVDTIDDAIRNREPIVFTSWKPHWLFRAYPIRYLKDPKGVYDQADHIHVIARKGLRANAPQAWKLLDTFTLTEQQLGSLELTIANSRSAWGGVRRWLETHEKIIAPWIAAATTNRRDYLR